MRPTFKVLHTIWGYDLIMETDLTFITWYSVLDNGYLVFRSPDLAEAVKYMTDHSVR